MTTEIFAPYETAKRLKEIRFNEPCLAYYDEYESIDYNITEDNALLLCYNEKLFENDIEIISAPTWEQVFKWFREKGFFGTIQEIADRKEYYFSIKIKDKGFYVDETGYSIYEQAQENLALELIKIYKKEQDNG